MQDQYYTFNMFDAQAWYVRDVILDRIELPASEVMRADSLQWRQREAALEDAHQEILFQGDYVKELGQAAI
jgi:trimethylamine monooxygenase